MIQQKFAGLKKEFKRTDVDRLRNLIKGKTDDSTNTQIGYKKKTIERKEGDIWTEKKKTWTIKNGIKQTVSKLDAIKKEVFMPLCCPECNKVMKKRLDKPNYKIHKKCFDCVVDFEGKLKHVPGRYEEYIKELEIRNKLAILDQTESYLLDVVNTSNEGYVSEHGDVERWVGGIDKEKYTKDITKYASKTREKFEKQLNDKKGA
jgi:hypothetical protein|tara:strand:+ start:45 stop:656 length:612 start_codon:yes stop_codon:yes gene_type:complete